MGMLCEILVCSFVLKLNALFTNEGHAYYFILSFKRVTSRHGVKIVLDNLKLLGQVHQVDDKSLMVSVDG